MSASKASKKRYWISLFLDDMQVGDNFQSGLLHITIVPWFVSDQPDEQLVKSFISEFSTARMFDLLVGKNVKFGPKKNVAVNLIRYSAELTDLHTRALAWFDKILARWAVKNPYVADKYVPHIRRRRGTKLVEADQLSVRYLYLIEAARQEDNLRTVAARVELK